MQKVDELAIREGETCSKYTAYWRKSQKNVTARMIAIWPVWSGMTADMITPHRG
jgi:hypothetical protein